MYQVKCLYTVIINLILMTLICSCTLSLTCVHTQCSASDVGDEVQSPTADVSATANIPAAAL